MVGPCSKSVKGEDCSCPTHSQGKRTVVQLDYVLLTATLMRQLVNVTIVDAADLACVVQSDHNMVVALLRLEKAQKVEGGMQCRKAIKNPEAGRRKLSSSRSWLKPLRAHIASG
eukprot:6473530-Amphidinium_carterae.3